MTLLTLPINQTFLLLQRPGYSRGYLPIFITPDYHVGKEELLSSTKMILNAPSFHTFVVYLFNILLKD